MSLFRRFFNRKPPDRLLEISERVYVFDCCFSTDVLEEDEYKVYMGDIVAKLQDYYPDSSFMVFNFREGDKRTQISDILSQYDMTVMEYPRSYEGCPIISLEMIHHYLRSSESWLSLAGQQNVLLMHCERGGWPVLAFMLAALLLFRKQYNGEQKTLEMVYKQAPRELLPLFTPLNPQPSQLRYLQYISTGNLDSNRPPSDTPLALDYIKLKFLPLFGEKGCRPVIRIYGLDSFSTTANKKSKLLFTSSETKKQARYYRPEECELVIIYIQHRLQGDVVLECVHLDHVREEMIFRVMFHTAFVRSRVLILSHDEVDIMWDARDQMPKNFKAEVCFLDADALPFMITTDRQRTKRLTHEEFFSNVVDGQDGLLPKEINMDAENGDIAPPPPSPAPPIDAPSFLQIMSPFLKEFEHLKIQLEVIKSATGNFGENKLIGIGGFGKVYRGEVSHSKGKSMAAFKRLDPRHGQGDAEFWKEVLMLSGYKHNNLVSLLGFCDEGREKILVYEYVPNGSLDRYLSSTHLTWRQRIKICVDVARGISCLHDDRGTMQRVIHRDIKSSNILLDDNWNAKVSDMGLSKIGPANQPHTFLITGNIAGTPGYCDPQYMYLFTLSKESDIYSFGVVLFEVLCGRLCYTYSNGKLDKILVPAWKKAYRERNLHEIVFQGLTQPMDSTSMEIFSGIAFQCLQEYREDRPTIAHVVEKLETALEFESYSDMKHGMEMDVKEYKEREESVEKEENNLQQSHKEIPEIRIEMDTGTPHEPKDASRESEPSRAAVERAIREARERAFAEVRQRAEVLAEKEKRDLIALREQAERNRLAEHLDADIKRWSIAKEGNLRALLSTLQYILGADSGWQPVSLTEIITTTAVKKAYGKATLCVHPYKLQQRGAHSHIIR